MVGVWRPAWGLSELVCVLKTRSSTAGPTISLFQAGILAQVSKC